jgi:VWFA-related protein
MKISSAPAFTIGLLLVVIFAAGRPHPGQQPEPKKQPITINTDLVVIWAQVLDSQNGTVVKGLGKDDFVLREDGKPQQISLVKEGHGQPLSIVMAVEGLGCAIEPPEWLIPRIRESLLQLGDDVEIALIAWQGIIELVQPLTKDHQVIADVIQQGSRLLGGKFEVVCKQTDNLDINLPRPGETIYQAARYLEKEASPGRRKIIIDLDKPQFINKTHFHTAAEVSELLESTRTTVYGMYFEQRNSINKYYGAEDYYRLNRKDKRRRIGGSLEEFIDETGGTLLIGKNREHVDEVFMQLTRLIGSSYTIGYYPENSEFNGKFRRLSLELSPSGKAKAGKVTIKTRSGYRALRPSSPAATETSPRQ